MKILQDGFNYKIFINRFFADFDYNKKDELIKFIKDFILKKKLKLHLNGFYKVKVYPSNIIGLFIELVKIDESDYNNSLDLRVLIYYDIKFYYECNDYFFVKNYNNVRFYNNKYYVLINEDFKDITRFSEYGDFIFGYDVEKVLNNSIII